MKTFILSLMLAMPLMAMAQNGWELPQNRQQSSEDKIKELKAQMKAAKEEQKAAKAALKAQQKAAKQAGATVTAAQEEKVAPKATKAPSFEPKYGPGAVPEVEGKVEWNKDITVPGASADNLFDKMVGIITEMTTSELSIKDKSFIAAVNKQEHVIAAHFEEKMTFQNATLSLDQAICRYTLVANCADGKVSLRIFRISYEYGRDKKETIMAEDYITDSQCMNAAQTRFYRGYGKFRMKTIDRKDEVFSYIDTKIK